MHINYLNIIIDKGTSNKIGPMWVPFYEYAILSAAHNGDSDEGTIENVHVQENVGDAGTQIRELPDDFSVDDEFHRMLAIYGRGDNVRYVRGVYRDEEAFETAIERNAEVCAREIKAGAEVSEPDPIMTQNPEVKRGRKNRRAIAKGEGAITKRSPGRPKKAADQPTA